MHARGTQMVNAVPVCTQQAELLAQRALVDGDAADLHMTPVCVCVCVCVCVYDLSLRCSAAGMQFVEPEPRMSAAVVSAL